MRCQKLFEKGCIGGVEIRNRVAMTAMGNGLASWDGEVSLELIRFYEDRARGGCGLIFTEFTRMDETSGACNPNQLCTATRKHIRSTERVRCHGARDLWVCCSSFCTEDFRCGSRYKIILSEYSG